MLVIRLKTLKKTFFFVSFLVLFPMMLFGQNSPGDILFQPFTGEQKLLFIRIQYPGDVSSILSDERAPIHAESLKQSFERNSYGKLTLTIDITPTLTMPQPEAFYKSDSATLTRLVRIRADAIKLAEDAGFPQENYSREVIFTRKIWDSPATGLGTLNMRTAVVGCDCPFLTAHELGHTMDWTHASFWKVFDNNPISANGIVLNYGDAFDMMGDQISGRPRAFHHFNPWFKYRVGWLPEENIKTVNETGEYTIQAFENMPQGTTPVKQYSSLRIRKDLQKDYWVFFRSEEDSVNYGPVITWGYHSNRLRSLLLDMHPLSHQNEWADAALGVGEIFYDEDAGIEIKVLETTPDSVRLKIFVPHPVTENLPVIDVINPARQSIVNGETDYTVTAYDPDNGSSNSDGISRLEIDLGQFLAESHDSFTVFSSAEFSSPPYSMHVDTDTIPDGVYFLFIKAISIQGDTVDIRFSHIVDNTGPSVPTGIPDGQNNPGEFQLIQNYPNPFNPSTTIRYSLPNANFVTLKIFNLLGQEIQTLVSEKQAAGQYSVIFDAKNLASGIYFYRLRAGEVVQTRKAVLMR